MSEREDVTVSENTEQSRYEAVTDAGLVAGFAEFEDHDDRRVFTHTEVDEAFEGQGVGSTLAAAALDDVRKRGLKLVAKCPFIEQYAERHPEYADLRA